jgi:hypothetical protein
MTSRGCLKQCHEGCERDWIWQSPRQARYSTLESEMDKVEQAPHEHQD